MVFSTIITVILLIIIFILFLFLLSELDKKYNWWEKLKKKFSKTKIKLKKFCAKIKNFFKKDFEIVIPEEYLKEEDEKKILSTSSDEDVLGLI